LISAFNIEFIKDWASLFFFLWGWLGLTTRVTSFPC
jgi:hypothetical protein